MWAGVGCVFLFKEVHVTFVFKDQNMDSFFLRKGYIYSGIYCPKMDQMIVDSSKCFHIGWFLEFVSKKSPTGPTERTPKPECLIALATYLGVRW